MLGSSTTPMLCVPVSMVPRVSARQGRCALPVPVVVAVVVVVVFVCVRVCVSVVVVCCGGVFVVSYDKVIRVVRVLVTMVVVVVVTCAHEDTYRDIQHKV